MSLEPGAEVEFGIDSLAAGGEGVGRHEGRAVFVPLTAPGDRVRARVDQVKRRWARAELIEILEPGPSRREPPCPYFGDCGGCSWMHVDEEEQTRARLSIVREALRRIGGLDALPPLEHFPSPTPLGYRSRARVACADGRIGFRARSSHEVVDVRRCAVLDPATQRALDELRASGSRGRGEHEIRGFDDRVQVAGREYLVPPGVFFQANATLWKPWLDVVVGACGTGRLALDLYSGVGFYAAALESSFDRVVAVERGRAAVAARRNTSAEVVDAAVEDWLPRELGDLAPDAVLLNPPRTGCHRSVTEALREHAPARLVYVSCEPSTLARDLSYLGSSHRVARLVVIDALPQTHHVEVVCVLDSSRS